MKKRILSGNLYIMFLIGAVLILSAFLFARDEVIESDNSFPASEVIPATTQQKNESTRVMTFQYESLPAGGDCLVFQTVHQSIEVYLGEQLTYSVMPVSSIFGDTTGTRWNFVTIPPNTHSVTVVLTGLYPATYERNTTFYFGKAITVYRNLLKGSLYSMVLSLFNFLIGLIILLYWFVTSRKSGNSRVLLYLGIFSSVMGLWSFGETTVADLLVPNRVACGSSAFVLLSLAPIPFLLFLRELLDIGDKWIWKIISSYCFGSFLCMVLLQLTGIADFRETVFLIHIGIVLVAFYTILAMIVKIRQSGFNHTVRLHIVSLFFIILSIVLDLGTYYTGTVKVDTFGRIGFFIYIAIMAIDTSYGTARRIEEGRKADYYKGLANTDMLTGLYNRNAFIADLEALSPSSDVLFFTFDLNELKSTNDLFGHAAGDQYLKEASALISDVFHSYGNCYRTGGDEFCVMILHGHSCHTMELVERFLRKENRYNHELGKDGVKVRIAYGFACFDSSIDTSLEDTMKRADTAMYDKKAKMKEEEA